MGLLDKLFNRSITSQENPVRQPSNVLFGMNMPEDLWLTPDQALSVSPVWACVRIISEAIASSHWHVYQRGPNGNRVVLPDDPLAYVLTVRPNPEMTAQAFKEAMLIQALVYGNSFAEIEYDNAGRVKHLWPLFSDRMQIIRDYDTNELVYRYTDFSGGPKNLPPELVYHLRGPSVRGLVGDSIIFRATKAIAAAAAQERFGLSYFGNGTIVGGVLKYPGKMPPGAAEKVAADWNETRNGVKGAHKMTVLEGGMDFMPISNNASEASLIPAQDFSVEAIARYFGVPLHLLQVRSTGVQGNGRNIEDANIIFINHTLRPWTKRCEQEADYKLLPQRAPWKSTSIELNWLARPDTLTRAQAYKIRRDIGSMTANEIRDAEGENSVGPEGDLLLLNGAYTIMNEEQLEKPEPTAPSGSAVPAESEDETDAEEPMDAEDGGTAGEEMDTEGPMDAAITYIVSGILDRHARRVSNRKRDGKLSDEAKQDFNSKVLAEFEMLRSVLAQAKRTYPERLISGAIRAAEEGGNIEELTQEIVRETHEA